MRKLLGIAWAFGTLLVGLAAALVIGTLFVLPFVWLPRGRRERWPMAAAGLWARFVQRLTLARVSVSGDPGLPPDGGALFLCNHRSWMDVILLLAHTGSNGLSKASIFWIPFVGIFGWIAGAVFFDRSSAQGRARARDDVLFLLGAGRRIHVFPEGTRTTTGRLRERVFLRLPRDCYEAGLPVVPCAVYGTERVMPVGAFEVRPGARCALRVLPAVYPRDFPDADAFADHCWAEVRRAIARLEAEA